ncbi:uncharacterized protein LOC108667727 [Hyalella azteca]|uniref:Uncharacterized protein LOC108667727 n=1 Tax=Hyalella azteca TaxID=294128 RepID=A0A8B7N9S7_HYAAZ|nr:uncharacterized protein LOC108667727 [Hyalella azteca]
MSEFGESLWDSYLTLAGELHQVSEIIYGGLAVALRLNHNVVSSVLRFSTHLISLLLLLISKTREMLSLLKADLLEFLSDVGACVHLVLSAVLNFIAVIITSDLINFLKPLAIAVAVTISIIFTVILCNYCGVFQLLILILRFSLVIIARTAKALQVSTLCLGRIISISSNYLARKLNLVLALCVRLFLIVFERVLDLLFDIVFLILAISHLLYRYLVIQCRRYRFCAFVRNGISRIIVSLARVLIRSVSVLRVNRLHFIYLWFVARAVTMFEFLARLLSKLSFFSRPIAATPANTNAAAQRPECTNHIYLERRINEDAVAMDVNRLDEYLVARMNMDRHNDMAYHYIVRENDAGALYVTVKPLSRKFTFIAARLLRAKQMLGFNAQLQPLVSKVSWNITHNFWTGKNYSVDTSRSSTATDTIHMPECVVCQDSERSMLLMPCGHLCLCRDCCRAIKNSSKLCPVCRRRIVETHKVYI